MFVTITTNVLKYYDKIVGSIKRSILYVTPASIAARNPSAC